MKVWRLTMECGHLRLSGPWDDDEPDDKHMIGDIAECEVCPRVRESQARGTVMRLRQVVNVERVPAKRYRRPEEKAFHGWMNQALPVDPTDRLEELWDRYKLDS